MKVPNLGIQNFSLYFRKRFIRYLEKQGNAMFKIKKAKAYRALRPKAGPGWYSRKG